MNAHVGTLLPAPWTAPASHPVLAAARPGPPPSPPGLVHLVPSLSMGGAERIALDLLGSAAARGLPLRILALREARFPHHVPAALEPGIERLGRMPWPERLDRAAAAILGSGLPGMCHLTALRELEALWARGATTVPVIHNARSGWPHEPTVWDPEHVPYAVACGEAVARELAEAGCPVPVVVLRHVVPVPPALDPARRSGIRAAFGAGPGTLLVGMTGRVVPQKRHDRAVAALADLVGRGVDARLAVVGHVDPADDGGAHAAAVGLALRLGVRDRVLFVGGVHGAGALAGAFDVHLNVSAREGVSIATMEAVAAGVPAVVLEAGGQAEALPPGGVPLPQDASPRAIADAVVAAAGAPRAAATSGEPHREAFRHAAADLWAWVALARCGPRPVPSADLLLVTGNMDVGGAQRSLGILAAELARRGRRVAVAVCGQFGVPDFLSAAEAAGARILDLAGGGGPAGRIGRVVAAAALLRPAALCFWNMDAVTKAGVAKALAGSGLRVADASPGPALFRELDEAAGELALLSTSPAAYLAGLDAFASKYDGGLPPVPARRQAVVRNGVPPAVPLPDGVGPAPAPGADPGLAVLVVGRLNATKKVSLLPLVARGLRGRVPGATLTVVGGVHRPGVSIEDAPGLRLLPPDTRASGFAGRFACLLMLSVEQGCPNASLEAMAAGIPVVANDDGGTSEQVVDGVTGRLVRGADDAALAGRAVEALAGLLSDPAGAASMGEAARMRVSQGFTVAAMADGYERLLFEGTE